MSHAPMHQWLALSHSANPERLSAATGGAAASVPRGARIVRIVKKSKRSDGRCIFSATLVTCQSSRTRRPKGPIWATDAFDDPLADRIGKAREHDRNARARPIEQSKPHEQHCSSSSAARSRSVRVRRAGVLWGSRMMDDDWCTRQDWNLHLPGPQPGALSR